jgi:hypothetical protein
LIHFFIAFASFSSINFLSFTITFQLSHNISQRAILLTASAPSFNTLCNTGLNGVSIKPCLSTFEYEAKCSTNHIFGHSGVAIGHILPY